MSNIFRLRKVAVHAVRDDTFWQALALHAQLLFVDIPTGLFLCQRCRRFVLAWRCLRDGKRERATACRIYHRQGRNLQPAFGPMGTAVKEVAKTKRLFSTLRKKRGILDRKQFRARVEGGTHHPLMNVWPIKATAELPRQGAVRVVTVATQSTKGDAPPQSEDRSNQHNQKLALRLTNRGHLLQHINDNCHRP